MGEEGRGQCQQHLLQADLLALDRPSHQTSKGGSLSRPEKAQFLWVTACFGDQVTHPPDGVPAGYPPSPSAFQQHPSYLPLAHPPTPGASPGCAPSPFPLPYPGEEKQGFEGQYLVAVVVMGIWKERQKKIQDR